MAVPVELQDRMAVQPQVASAEVVAVATVPVVVADIPVVAVVPIVAADLVMAVVAVPTMPEQVQPILRDTTKITVR